EVKKVTAKGKIVVPGKDPSASSGQGQKPSMNEIVKALLDSAKVAVPKILVEQETDGLLAQLLDDVKRLGMNLDQYLASTKRTVEDLKGEYFRRAGDDITLEFV